MPKMPQMDLIAELKKRQVKPQVREGKDGVLEDIITGRNKLCAHECEKNNSQTHFSFTPSSDLKNTPYRRTDGRRPAQRQDT